MGIESKFKAFLYVVATVALCTIIAYGIFSGRETEIEIPGGFRARIGEEPKLSEPFPPSTSVLEGYAKNINTDKTSNPLPPQILSIASIRSCTKKNAARLVQGSITPRELINTCFVSDNITERDFDLAERQKLYLAKKLNMTRVAAYAVAELGHEFYLRGEYTASRIFSEAMVLLDYSQPYFYDLVGSSYSAQKDWLAAIDSFNKSLEFDPENAVALFNRGVCLQEFGAKDKALQDFKKVTALKGPVRADIVKRAKWEIENSF